MFPEKSLDKMKNQEDVQVFTSLPPKVEGEAKCYLRMRISKVNWLGGQSSKEKLNDTKKPIKAVSISNKRSGANESPITMPLFVKCLWWGEESLGAMFRPEVLVNGLSTDHSSRPLQTIARYVVRSGPRQLSAYFNGKYIN
jgi:hypothetical protein